MELDILVSSQSDYNMLFCRIEIDTLVSYNIVSCMQELPRRHTIKVSSLAGINLCAFKCLDFLKHISFQIILHCKYMLFPEYVYGIEATPSTGAKNWFLQDICWRCWIVWMCYTLSRPETHRVLGDCTMGYGTSVSSAIPSIPFCSSSCLFRLLIHP